MGLPLIHGSPPRRRESEPYPAERLPTLRFSSCGQEHSFHYYQVHLICPQTVRCWMFGFRSCATPSGTSRRETMYLCIQCCPYEINSCRTSMRTTSAVSSSSGVIEAAVSAAPLCCRHFCCTYVVAPGFIRIIIERFSRINSVFGGILYKMLL